MENLLSTLKPAPGSRTRKKRVGRGQGSGHGKTATRGHKGAGSRSGSKSPAWFEGGQMPLSRRVPKRGFHSPFRKEFQVVNVASLARLAAGGKLPEGVVTPDALAKLGVVRASGAPVKVLGDGELTAKLEVSAHAFSKQAVQKIEAAGGKALTITSAPRE